MVAAGAPVEFEEDRALAGELVERWRSRPPERAVWVTDLVDPRPAFWRVLQPVRPGPERQARMDAGREAHVAIAARLGPPTAREVRVRRDGVVGQIDLWEDRPTEVKTTSSLPPTPDLKASRPQYVEQIAMYCALAEERLGRLVLLEVAEGAVAAGLVVDLEVARPEQVLRVMVARGAALREAWKERRPVGLPLCSWFGRGCEFQEAGVCDCTGAEAPLPPDLLDEVGELRENPPERDRILREVARIPAESPPSAHRFRDLLFPRRAFFERTRPAPSPPSAVEPEAPLPRGELWGHLADLLESGSPQDVELVPARGGVPPQRVSCFRGRPYLVKTSRAWRPLAAAELARSRPHYVTELELRCAAAGRPEGLLLLGYERAESLEDRLAVFRIRFPSALGPENLVTLRESGLARALATGDPSGLPMCPGWMFDDCPYRSECGCGSDAGRAQR